MAFFSRWKDQEIPQSLPSVATVDKFISDFLSARGAKDFRVSTILHEGQILVLVQARAQKSLRFSNLIELQLVKKLAEQLSVNLAGVFWRFQMEVSEQPAPEQADYDDYPSVGGGLGNESPSSNEPVVQAASDEAELSERTYDIRRMASQGVEVAEVSYDDFAELLKGQKSP